METPVIVVFNSVAKCRSSVYIKDNGKQICVLEDTNGTISVGWLKEQLKKHGYAMVSSLISLDPPVNSTYVADLLRVPKYSPKPEIKAIPLGVIGVVVSVDMVASFNNPRFAIRDGCEVWVTSTVPDWMPEKWVRVAVKSGLTPCGCDICTQADGKRMQKWISDGRAVIAEVSL